MARRSKLDLEVGDQVRAHELVRCPQCGAETIWRGIPELERHVYLCRKIELGLAVGGLLNGLTPPPLDDLLPEVPKKPKGYQWGGR